MRREPFLFAGGARGKYKYVYSESYIYFCLTTLCATVILSLPPSYCLP